VLTQPPSSSSVLALVTTIHLGLAALRNHRALSAAPVSSLAVISLALGGLPWMFPSAIGLGVGLAIHAGWFALCEVLVPARERAESPSPSSNRANQTRTASSPPPAPARRPAASARPSSGPTGFVQAPVLAVLNETPTIKTIRMARPDGFDFEAGQFVTVRVRADGKEYARCYSISSPPHVRGYLEISVKRHGVVSNALHAAVRPGSMLAIRRPVGAFKYPAGDDRPIVLIAGGIGITPLVSMLRHAIAVEPGRPITLLYGVHSEDEFAFRDDIVVAARRHPQVRVLLAASGGSTRPDVYPGRIDGSLITTVPDLAHSISLICGPAPMIDAMKALLKSAGVPPQQIRHEVFKAAIAASAEPADAPEPIARRAAAAPTQVLDRAATHRMVCARTGTQVVVGPGQTLLEAAEAEGIEVASLCRAGVCGTCRVQVRNGEVDCPSNALDAQERDQGFVLACVSTPLTDCTVDL
jgi:ferredoxin-NADP reductase